MPSLLVAGGGAIGIAAAVLAARARPDLQVTVLDAGTRVAADRTFVLGCKSALELPHQAWERIASCSLPLRQADISFAGAFGRMRLEAADIKSEAYAFSCAEPDFIAAWREMAAAAGNLEIVPDASVAAISSDSRQAVATCADGRTHAADCLAVAGPGPKVLAQAGFAGAARRYRQSAFAASIADGDAAGCSCASERIMAAGAATLIPRRRGWGFIMIASAQQCTRLQQLPDDRLLAEIGKMHSRAFSAAAKVASRGCFQPLMRITRPGGRGRIALLGASACALNPIGAQELNLGLRDCILLARLLAGAQDGDLQEIGRVHAAGRRRDRAATARRTDLAARIAAASLPGKTALGGLMAAIAELAPPVRRACLAAWVLPKS